MSYEEVVVETFKLDLTSDQVRLLVPYTYGSCMTYNGIFLPISYP